MWFPTLLSYALGALAILAGIALLLSALWSVRVSASVHGTWDGTLHGPHAARLSLEYGFPGFMRRHEWPGPESGTAAPAAPDTRETATPPPPPPPPPSFPSPSGTSPASPSRPSPAAMEAPRAPEPPSAATSHAEEDPRARPRNEAADERKAEPGKAPNRWRKALFRLATDGPAWMGLAGFLRRAMRLTAWLLHARLELVLAHPDPALLGRTAGYWHAFTGPTPLRHVRTEFRFCAPHPAVTMRARGGFSVFELVVFAMALFVAFPWFRLARRMRWSWKHREPGGWRGFLYRLIQSV